MVLMSEKSFAFETKVFVLTNRMRLRQLGEDNNEVFDNSGHIARSSAELGVRA